MGDSCNPCGGNGNGNENRDRRQFLKTAAATGAALGSANQLLAQAPAPAPADAPPAVPLVKLGKTGRMVSKLGMGTSWALALRASSRQALASGVRYIDTAEDLRERQRPRPGRRTMFLNAPSMRKDVYLVTKNSSFRQAKGNGDAKRLRATSS